MGGIRYADIKELPRFPETLDGESLLPQLTGNVARRREWAFCAYHGDRCATGTFMLRRGQWKSIVHTGFSPELFDLVADPWETTNLATKRPEIAAQLDAILAGNFDCAGIDARAKQYDRENFTRWRAATKKAGTLRRYDGTYL